MKKTPFHFLPLCILILISVAGCKTIDTATKAVKDLASRQPTAQKNSIPELEKVLLKNPSNKQALMNLAWAYYNLGDFPKAEEAFINYGRHYPFDQEYYKGLAYSYYRMDEFYRSADEYRKWLSVDPKSKEAGEGLGACYIQLGKDIPAEDELKKYYSLGEQVEKFPDWYYPYLLLGQKKVEEKAFGEAQRFFLQALELNPGCAQASEGIREIIAIGERRIQLPRQYQEKESYQMAIQFYTKTAREFPFWAEPYIGMGQCYAKLGMFKDSEASFRRAIQLDPDSRNGWKGIRDTINLKVPTLNTAWQKLENREYMGAISAFEDVLNGPDLRKIPEDHRWLVYRGLGWGYFYYESYEDARENFEETLRQRENDPEALKGLGMAYYRLNSFPPAEMFLEMAEKSLGEDLELGLNLGWLYYHRAKYEKAAEKFEYLLGLDPKNLEVKKGSAWSFAKAGNLLRAKAEFYDLLELDPEYVTNKDFRQLVTLTPQWWDFSNMLGWYNYNEKDFEGASRAFASSLAQAPGNPDALQGMAFIQFRKAKYKDAAHGLEAVLKSKRNIAPITEQDPLDYKNKINSNTRSKLGWCYYFIGKYKEAAEEFKITSKENPAWLHSLYGLGLSLQKLPNLDEAEKTYQAVLSKNPGHANAKSGLEDIKKLREEAEKKKKGKKKRRWKKKKKKAAKKKEG